MTKREWMDRPWWKERELRERLLTARFKLLDAAAAMRDAEQALPRARAEHRAAKRAWEGNDSVQP